MGNPTLLMRRLPRQRDERGSLIVVLTVIFVMVLLCSAIAFQLFGNQQNVLTRSSSASSVSAADAGLSDALFRLDQISPNSGTAFCMDATGTGVLGGSNCVQASGDLSGVSYTAVPNSAGSCANGVVTCWTINAKAIVNGVWGAVSEEVDYSVAYPFAVFGNSGLDFNGNNSNGLGTYNDTSTAPPDTSTADCPGTTNVSSCVQVGSNGPIKCAGNLASNVSEVYYTNGGGVSTCANPVPNPSKFPILPVTAPPSVSSPNCPGLETTDSNGDNIYELGTGYRGAPSSLQAGIYYCNNSAIAISGQLSVQGTVQLYIILDGKTDSAFINNGVQTLYIAGGSEVNVGFDGTSGPPTSPTSLPVAQNLQILSNSTGTVGSANGGGANGPFTFGGVIYAPTANLVGNGCKSAYYGSLTINTLTCNGGPHLQVYYDNALKSVLGSPEVSGYAQVNPNTFTVP